MSPILRFNLSSFLFTYISRIAPSAGEEREAVLRAAARDLLLAPDEEVELAFLRLTQWTGAGLPVPEIARRLSNTVRRSAVVGRQPVQAAVEHSAAAE